LFVEVNGDLDLFSNAFLFVNLLALVDPLKVNSGKSRRKFLSELDSIFMNGVFSTLHKHIVDDKSLLVSSKLFFTEVELKLQF